MHHQKKTQCCDICDVLRELFDILGCEANLVAIWRLLTVGDHKRILPQALAMAIYGKWPISEHATVCKTRANKGMRT